MYSYSNYALPPRARGHHWPSRRQYAPRTRPAARLQVSVHNERLNLLVPCTSYTAPPPLEAPRTGNAWSPGQEAYYRHIVGTRRVCIVHCQYTHTWTVTCKCTPLGLYPTGPTHNPMPALPARATPFKLGLCFFYLYSLDSRSDCPSAPFTPALRPSALATPM